MSRLCFCMVVVFALTTLAEAGVMTTQDFLDQVLTKKPKAQNARITEAETKAAEKLKLPNVKQFILPERAPRLEPIVLASSKGREGTRLLDIDKTGLMDITGIPQLYAADAIIDAGLRVAKISYDYSDTIPAGCVIRQEPEAGTPIEEIDSSVSMVVAQTEIAIQPFPIQRSIGGEVEGWGQLIVHRPFDVELRERIQHIPIFAIAYEGLRHANIEARAQSIAENLSIAWGILDEGGYLDTATDDWIMPDDAEQWRLRGPFAPNYDKEAPKPFPAIYVRHEKLGNKPLRIMTVYPEDAAFFGQPADRAGTPTLFSDQELAEYLISLIKAHHLLLAKRDNQLEDFKRLEICTTREGEIFKEICLRAIEETKGTGTISQTSSTTDLRSALARVAMTQRYRLMTLAYNAPRDWRLRNSTK
jgi:hypothetical protein